MGRGILDKDWKSGFYFDGIGYFTSFFLKVWQLAIVDCFQVLHSIIMRANLYYQLIGQ